MSAEPKSPTAAELPRLSDQLKDEISKASEDLKHVETVLKDVQPSKQALLQERAHERFKSDIENFDGEEQLRHVKTAVKDQRPTAEQIAQEKAARVAAQIVSADVDIGSLNHVEPQVKSAFPVGTPKSE